MATNTKNAGLNHADQTALLLEVVIQLLVSKGTFTAAELNTAYNAADRTVVMASQGARHFGRSQS